MFLEILAMNTKRTRRAKTIHLNIVLFRPHTAWHNGEKRLKIGFLPRGLTVLLSWSRKKICMGVFSTHFCFYWVVIRRVSYTLCDTFSHCPVIFCLFVLNVHMLCLICFVWNLHWTYLKFIYSEKATKCCEISTLLLSVSMYCRQK